MPTIAVTGATGFVGRAVVERLLQDHPADRIRLLVRNAKQRKLPELFNNIPVVEGDLNSMPALKQLVSGASTVIHIAAAIAGNSAQDFGQINRQGTSHLLSAIRQHAADSHLIHLSSLAARSPELSWYAQSKRDAELAVQSSGISYSMLRPPAVYGPNDPALAEFWSWLARGWLFRLGPAHARFSLLQVDDLAEAVARLLNFGPSDQIFSLHDDYQTNGQPGWTWPQLASVAGSLRGRPVRTLAIPSALLATVAQINLSLAQMLSRPAMLSPGKRRELLHADWVCDNQAIKLALDWQPTTSLAQSLANLPGWKNQ